jgi:mono/diheme cytochrome c family protein
MKRIAALAAAFVAAAALPFALAIAPAMAEQGAPSSRVLRQGKTIYKQACAGCHKWHGGGGGGYGGAAMSLRTTHLDMEQLIEVIRCGRPMTGMPQHTADAYDDDKCYGITKGAPGVEFPMKANAMLRPDEIAAVAAYVAHTLQGKGEQPSLAECQDYWGPNSHNCKSYQPQSSSDASTNPDKGVN